LGLSEGIMVGLQLAMVVLLQMNVGKFKICWMCELNWSVFDWH
jgi:hypothetical protein